MVHYMPDSKSTVCKRRSLVILSFWKDLFIRQNKNGSTLCLLQYKRRSGTGEADSMGCTLQINEPQLQRSTHQCAKHQRATHQPWVVEVQSTLALPKALQINGSIHQPKNFGKVSEYHFSNKAVELQFNDGWCREPLICRAFVDGILFYTSTNFCWSREPLICRMLMFGTLIFVRLICRYALDSIEWYIEG
jgi:hypothetical protein